MTFENFSRVTHATLLNEPCVSSFYDVVFDAARVKRGDLFVGNDPEAIKEALSRGAYAILSDQKVPIRDEEIAWLRCETIDDALTRLLRYRLMQEGGRFFHFDQTSIELMQKITHKAPLLFLSGDIRNDFSALYTATPETIVIGSDERMLQKIYPAYQILTAQDVQLIRPYRSTLFQSTFYHRGKLYENIKIPPLFLQRLSAVLHFLEAQGIDYHLQRCDFTPSLYPLFVNRNLQPQPFGSTPSAIVLTAHTALFEEIAGYMREKAPWATTCILCKEAGLCPGTGEKIRYNRLDEIKALKKIEFNFAIIEAGLPELLQTLKNLQTKEQLSLFQE